MPDPGRDPPPTIQMRSDASLEDAAPVMATVTGGPTPESRPPPMPPPRYELGEEIARGGMGRVVEATDTMLGRVVALKEALALDAEALRRFARETKITARLEHPSIVPVHDAGTMAGGAPFYVMRKVGGRPLERLVATAETLNQRLALIQHVIAAAHAVAHAHERGVVHRDIKPSNILCGDLGETIVIDWGLAKVIGEADELTDPAAIDLDEPVKTRAGIVFGTPGFMAPEQLRGNLVSERCDVYALGATLYHLLSRKPPHHAKTADEMMKAAASAPPTPIDKLVPGVPPELSTIVDKALAHDPKDRYQNARALAEDLNHFLTGQLVAAHRYTPRERIVRFVRKHRVPVAAVGAASLALIVIGAIAVTRVIGERDRADGEASRAKTSAAAAVEAQHHAEDRAEKLMLQQARTKVTTNPTEAIAMIKPFATKQWREVRSIAIAARAGGVAWSLPGPTHVQSIELSRDGQRALVAGIDGSVRVYDLAHRAATILVARGPVTSARFADNDRRIVAWSGRQLAVLDATTGARVSDLAAPTPIVDLEVIGVQAYWVDDRGAVWHLDLAGKVPIEIPLPEKIVHLAPSPDGRWIALHGVEHLLIHDRTEPAKPPTEVLTGKLHDLDWADDSKHLVALYDIGDRNDKRAVDIQIGEVPTIIHRVRVGGNEHATYASGRIYALGPLGVGVMSRYELSNARIQVPGGRLGVRVAIDQAVVAAGAGGLAVLTDTGDHPLAVPIGQLEAFAVSQRSPYVVGLVEGRVLVWNLADVLPRRLAARQTLAERFIGNDRVLVAYGDGAEWIELATRKSTPFAGSPSALLEIAGAPDGRAACIIDATHHARLFVPGREPEELGSVDVAVFAGTKLVLGTVAGVIQVHDVETKRRTPLVARAAKLVHLVASRQSPAWIAAAFADSTLWRANLATGEQSSTPIEGVPGQIALRADGAVLFPAGQHLRTWTVGGAIEPLAELPKPALALGVVGPDRAVAFTDAGVGFVVRTDAPNSVSPPFDVYGSLRASISPESGLMVLVNRGVIEVVDPLVPHRWTLASALGLTYSEPQISSDGTHVIARSLVTDHEKRDGEGRIAYTLLAWRIVMPSTAEDMPAWLDQLTNAVVDQKQNLSWQ